MFSLRRNPRLQLICALGFFFFATAGHIPLPTALFILVVCLGFTVGPDMLLSWIRTRAIIPPYSAIITGFILALIADTAAPWYQLAFICIAAIIQKQFFRIGGRHIWNPAAFGLLIGWIVFGMYPSWWGASLYNPNLLSLNNLPLYAGLGAILWVSGYKYKRYGTVSAFLFSFTVLFALIVGTSSIASLVLTVISPGVLFYAFLMLPEPMTSPVYVTRQALYGVSVAVFNVALTAYIKSHAGIFLPDSSLLALLAGNTLFFRFR